MFVTTRYLAATFNHKNVSVNPQKQNWKQAPNTLLYLPLNFLVLSMDNQPTGRTWGSFALVYMILNYNQGFYLDQIKSAFFILFPQFSIWHGSMIDKCFSLDFTNFVREQ